MTIQKSDTAGGVSEALSPVIFYYFNMTGTESFCTLLEDRFRQTGHSRPILFKEWNCYNELPGEDADLIAYDGVVLSALADKGYLSPVPDDVSAGDVFPWVMTKSRVRRKTYGLPIMMCSNALICRKKDDLHIRNIMELHENTAIPMRSMLMFYYIQAVCNNRSPRQSLKVLEHLLDLIGGRDFLEESRLADYDGINRFNREECRYFLGFTEVMLHFKKDDYVISFANFSQNPADRNPLFMVDFVSPGKNMQDEKRNDCLDLIRILVDEQFIRDVCTLDGRLQYLLPANRRVFPVLAGYDPLYGHLYSLLESEENGILRYGKRFYEDFNRHGDILLQFLWEKAGWKPAGWKPAGWKPEQIC